MLLCAQLIKYQAFWATPSAVKACTGHMIYFYQVFPLLRKVLSRCDSSSFHSCSLLHLHVPSIPCSLVGSCWVYSEIILPMTGAPLHSPAGHLHPYTFAEWGAWRYYRTVAPFAIALKSGPIEMQIRTLIKGHIHPLHRSQSLRSHPCFAVESTSDWVTVSRQSHPPRLIQRR